MKILYEIDKKDIREVKMFYESQKDKSFVKNRIKRNIDKNIPSYSNDIFWQAMISCLITTQQRSGPYSVVTSFILTKPFPLNYQECRTQKNLKEFAGGIISRFGLRRGKTIGEEIEENFHWLENGGWETIEDIIEELSNFQDASTERKSAEIIIDHLKGFGPKQSRNLLQSLGLTKYEIPVDSRITKWLTDFGFPIKLSASALGDKHYYNFVLDAVQKTCEASDIFPCVLDAAIFASYDEDWPEDRLIW